MQISKLTCSDCGANRLVEVEPGTYECEYCRARYLIRTDTKTGHVCDVTIKGDMSHVPHPYAVHDRLIVKGDMNHIQLVSTAKDATHVGKLVISGDMNHVTVVLLDGADYRIKGDMNHVNDCR